ncbi:unnamed protein product [Victoria cruziana]
MLLLHWASPVIYSGGSNQWDRKRDEKSALSLSGEATAIMPTRNLRSGLKMKDSILQLVPNAKLNVMEHDLGYLGSVRSLPLLSSLQTTISTSSCMHSIRISHWKFISTYMPSDTV